MFKKFFVLAIIVVLMILMFLPNYLRVQFGENENIVKSKLRAVYEACELYKRTHRPSEYPESLQDLINNTPPLLGAGYLEKVQAGYLFNYQRKNTDKFSVVAKPNIKFLTGYRTYFIDETGIIRLNNSAGDPIDA